MAQADDSRALAPPTMQYSRAWELTWEEVCGVFKRIAIFITGVQDGGVLH